MTTPADTTFATLAFEDRQLACVVTACVEPFESAAVAVNGALEPTAGAVPLTVTLVTDTAGGEADGGEAEGEVEGLLPHAQMSETIAIEPMTAGSILIPAFGRAVASVIIESSSSIRVVQFLGEVAAALLKKRHGAL